MTGDRKPVSWVPEAPSMQFQRGLFEVRRGADGTIEVFRRQVPITHAVFECGACGGILLSNVECDFLVHDDPGDDVSCTEPWWKLRVRQDDLRPSSGVRAGADQQEPTHT